MTTHTNKMQRQKGYSLLNNAPILGYEIHCGITEGVALEKPLIQFEDRSLEGAIGDDEKVIGNYHHGLFGQEEASLELLRLPDGLEPHIDVEALFSDTITRLELTEKLRPKGESRVATWNA